MKGLISIFGFCMLVLLSGCGGALEQRKQQVTVSINPSEDVVLRPGERLGLKAGAKAIDEPLTAMKWSVVHVDGKAPKVSPVLTNADCANGTLTVKHDDGVGDCSAELVIPKGAQEGRWRVAILATATSKGTASASFLATVTAPPVDTGNFRLDVPALIDKGVDGRPLRAQVPISVTAVARSDYAMRNLQYQWTQPEGQEAVLVGAKSSQLKFVPSAAGNYRFTVTATAVIGQRTEVVSAEVLVIVAEGNADDELVVFAGDAKTVQAAALVTLQGAVTFNGNAVADPVYQWTQLAGTAVTLASANNAAPTFFAPGVPKDEDLIFQLTATAVIAGKTYTGQAITVIRVKSNNPVPDNGSGNFRIDVPSLVYLDAQGKPLYPGALITVKAQALSEKTITQLQYQWTKKQGPEVVLAGVGTDTLQFVPTLAGNYELVVKASAVIDNRTYSVERTVLVVVRDGNTSDQLFVFAGDAQSVAPGDLVRLGGSVTFNGAAVANPLYTWTQLSGNPSVTFSNKNALNPTFFAPAVTADTQLVFQLEVNANIAGANYSNRAQTVVRIVP